MHINVLQLTLIVVFTCLAYWANSKINDVPKLNNIFSVLIVVVGVILLVASLIGRFNSHITIS